LREIAIRNREASGAPGPLPAALTAPPPEKPLPYEDDDMGDLSVDLTANGFDPSESFNMDKSLADDIVPVADPGIEKAVTVSRFSLHPLTLSRRKDSRLAPAQVRHRLHLLLMVVGNQCCLLILK
jgi:hypothetical protein